MGKKILKNKPLIEAIFNLKWELHENEQGIQCDPNYKILIGSIYENIKKEYPFYEPLPSSVIPDESATYIVQHRFRKGKEQWPVIQIGPGIISINETSEYNWNDFQNRIDKIVKVLFKVYPEPEKFKVNRLNLRYIDGFIHDYAESNIFDYMAKNMKIKIELDSLLFENNGIEAVPKGLDMKFSYPSSNPDGSLDLRFVKSKINKEDALVWETIVQSDINKPPNKIEDILQWVEEAHNLTDDLFFKMIEGELERRFE